MGFLCFIGLHKWKLIARWSDRLLVNRFLSTAIWYEKCECVRCGETKVEAT